MQPSNFQKIRDIPCEGEEGHHGYRLFLASNEVGEGKLLSDLKTKKTAGSVMIGTSALFSLDIFAARSQGREDKLKYLVIIDVSKHVQKFWNNVIPIIKNGKNREQVQMAILQEVLKNQDYYFPNMNAETEFGQQTILFMATIEANTSWLSDDTRFNSIQKLFRENRFAFVLGDYTNVKFTIKVAKFLSGMNLAIDTLYLSNIREYAEAHKVMLAFRISVSVFKVVINDDSIIIDTEPRVNHFLDFGPKEKVQTLRLQTKFRTTCLLASIPSSPVRNANKEFTDYLEKFPKDFQKKLSGKNKMLWAAIVLQAAFNFKIFKVEDYFHPEVGPLPTLP